MVLLERDLLSVFEQVSLEQSFEYFKVVDLLL